MLGIIKAEFVAWSKAYEGPHFHAVLCDPPYGLEFMGKEWDAPQKRTFSNRTRQETVVPQAGPEKYQAGKEYQVWTTEWAQALLPLLHPGALVFAFGGTRTWHRLACGFEDAGFEMWDTLMWLHGQGFPKAQAIDKLIDRAEGVLDSERPIVGEKLGADRLRNQTQNGKRDGEGRWGNESGRDPFVRGAVSEKAKPWEGFKTAALKPAWEPILCFRAPRQGKNYAELALEYGSGALNVDGARVGYQSDADKSSATPQGECTNLSGRHAGKAQGGGERAKFERPEQKGRYPANLVLECTCEQTEVVDLGETKPRSSNRTAIQFDPGRGWNQHSMNPNNSTAPDNYGGKAIRHTDPNCPAYLLDEQVGEKPTSAQSTAGREMEGNLFGIRRDGEHYGDKGGPSRFFFTVATEKICFLCDMPYDGPICKNTSVPDADTRSNPTQETTANTVQQDALGKLSAQLAPNVRSAGNLCNSCVIVFARALAETKLLGFSNVESVAIPAFIGSSKSSILRQNLASFVALWGSTDTIPTTGSLSLLCGSVRNAIAESTNSANGDLKASISNGPIRFRYVPKASRSERGKNNKHPTVKPVALTKWLATLLLPPDSVKPRRLLVPFAGSGSEMIGAIEAGWDEVVGIEQSGEYAEINSGLGVQPPLLR